MQCVPLFHMMGFDISEEVKQKIRFHKVYKSEDFEKLTDLLRWKVAQFYLKFQILEWGWKTNSTFVIMEKNSQQSFTMKYTLFYKQHFYKQHQVEIGKKLSKS